MDLCKVKLTLQPAHDVPSGFKTSLNISLAEVPLNHLMSAKMSQVRYNYLNRHFFIKENIEDKYEIGIKRAFICSTWQIAALHIFNTLDTLFKECERFKSEKDDIIKWLDTQNNGYNMKGRMFYHELYRIVQKPDMYNELIKDQLYQQLYLRNMYQSPGHIKTIIDCYIDYLTEQTQKERII